MQHRATKTGGSNERERRATVVLGKRGDRTLIVGIER